MKRIVAILLVITFLLCYTPIDVAANETAEFVTKNICFVVDKDGSAYEIYLPVIIKDGELYMHPENIVEITRYTFSITEKGLLFMLGQKSILIDKSGQVLQVNLTEQPFSGSLMVGDNHYLPLSELLPWMNVQCYAADNKLHIDSDILSFWEVSASFQPSDYEFNLADTYGETTGSVVGLIAISVFDCFVDLGNIWKRVVSIDDGETRLYDYEVYKECFREFALPEIGTEAEVQNMLDSLSEMVSDSSQFSNAYFEALFNQEMHDTIAEIFGDALAEDFEEWPIEATQLSESLSLAKDALKYMKTGFLYTRIAMSDTKDYSDTLRYMYISNDFAVPDGVKLAASEAIFALDSQAGAIADGAATILADVGQNILEEAVEEGSNEAIRAVASDTIFSSLGLYLDIVDATLSLVWPINDAFAEMNRMVVYQSIQYDALNAYLHTPQFYTEVSAQDISIGRTCALIFLKTARKCFQANQGTFDLYGGEGVLDWKINLINEKILEFELTSLAEEHDTISDKSEAVANLKRMWYEEGFSEIQNCNSDQNALNFSFATLPQEFIFTSGAGAWMTALYLSNDGTFTGIFHDTDAGDTGEAYPNGTMYNCGFQGHFSNPVRLDEYTYVMSVDKLDTDFVPGEVSYNGGYRYINTEPYGFDNADDFYIYLPGKLTSDLPQPCYEWVSRLHELSDALPPDLYIIYNMGGEMPFIGTVNSSSETEEDSNQIPSHKSQIEGKVVGISGKLNIRSGPGTEYEIVGSLDINTSVIIYELVHQNATTWGRTDDGWICMNYIKIDDDVTSTDKINAIDYVGLSTGEVIDRLGPEYIHAGYWAGSYLFYFVKYPDVYFSFNNYDPGNIIILGNENVPVIYLFHTAKINNYLSADMNKAEIDTAIRNMPDVQNIQTGTYYAALDNVGNIFQYEIETSTGYIGFEWHLDQGGSIDNAANEIWIYSK